MLKLPFIHDLSCSFVVSQKTAEMKDGACEVAQEAKTPAAASDRLGLISGPIWQKDVK